MQKSCVFMGSIPIGALFFMRIENMLLLSQSDTYIEIISDLDNLERDINLWCRFKGEEFVDKKQILNENKLKKGNFIYTIKKKTQTKFETFDPSLNIAPQGHGLAPNGVDIELASPNYHFNFNSNNEIWSNNLEHIYEESKRSQWNATTDISWDKIPAFSKEMEFAIAQIMTYLTENEFSALYIPSKFLSQISPYFTSIPMLLSSIIGDESRHIEAFIKRANATGLGVQYSTITTQQSLYSLWKEEDYFKSSFLLHVMGEGTFIDLLRFIEESFISLDDKESAYLLSLARRDETRHVAYGMSNIKHTISQNPSVISKLKEVVFNRKNYLDNQSSESSLLLESLAIMRGGNSDSSSISQGFEEVLELKKKMEKNRTKRLIECGIDEDLANDLSKAHTPNFM